MRPPAQIASWMEPAELEQWVHEASTKESYRRRLAIWWTTRGYHAGQVAELLQSSSRTVRYWIRQFNVQGPAALDSENHGGRRAARLTETEEKALLARLHPQAKVGQWVTVSELRQAIEADLGTAVSTSYLYDLLHRHGWRKVLPRPRHVAADPDAQEAFKKFSIAAPTPAGQGSAAPPAVRAVRG